MGTVLAVREAKIVAYRNFLLTLFTVRQREWPIIKPGVDESLLIAHCDEALLLLSPKLRTVLRQRFGLEDGRTRTHLAIGREFFPQMTKQWIFTLEKRALSKLRHPSRSRRLREFINYVGG